MSGEWTSNYLGIPYLPGGSHVSGCDCYGLVRLVYEREMGILLPDYGQPDCTVRQREMFKDARREPFWKAVPIQEAERFDVVELLIGGIPLHCGLYVNRGRFLHVMRGIETVIERLDAPQWELRLGGIYRYVAC